MSVFVGALGASNFTYAEARWSEGLADWISVHVNALAAIGGVPKAVVCDNLKAGVTKRRATNPASIAPIRSSPPITVLLCCRRGSKSRAIKQRPRLRSKSFRDSSWRGCATGAFFSLDELNASIRECVADLNAKIMRKLGKSRRELLETIECPALKSLPAEPYRYAEWKRARVAPDYHIEIAGHYYSVPSRLIREIVEARITSTPRSRFSIAARASPATRSRP